MGCSGQAQGWVGFVLKAQHGRLLPNHTVLREARRNVASTGALQACAVGQIACGFAEGGWAAGPVKGASQLAGLSLTALLRQCKSLRQHGLVLFESLRQDFVARLAGRKHHIQNLKRGALFCQLLKQLGLGASRPRPWANDLQAALVNVHQNNAALVLRLGQQAPSQVGAQLL